MGVGRERIGNSLFWFNFLVLCNVHELNTPTQGDSAGFWALWKFSINKLTFHEGEEAETNTIDPKFWKV